MEEKSLQEVLDDIALAAVMLDPGDLAELGRLLNSVEEVLASKDSTLPDVARKIANGLKLLLEQTIMSQEPVADTLHEKINLVVSILQEVYRKKSVELSSPVASQLDGIFGGLVVFSPEDDEEGRGGKRQEGDDAAEAVCTKIIDLGEDREDRDCFVGFVGESVEYLQQIEMNIVNLEQSPHDKECINAIFRPFHTMKGLSAFLNLEDINRLTHQTENILDKARNDELTITSGVTDLILDVVDVLKKMIADVQAGLDSGRLELKDYGLEKYFSRIRAIEEGEGTGAETESEAVEEANEAETESEPRDEGESNEKAKVEDRVPSAPRPQEQQQPTIDLAQDKELLINFAAESTEHLQQIEVDILSLEQSPDDKECINAVFRPFHTIKGVAGFLNLQDIKRLSHETENILDRARNGELLITSRVTDLILDVVDVLKKMVADARQAADTGTMEQKDYDLDRYIERIKAIQEGRQIDEKRPEAKSRPKDSTTKAKAPEGKPQEVVPGGGKPKPERPVPIAVEEKHKPPAVQTASAGNAIKVDSIKLDNLVDMVGELVIVQSLIYQNPIVQATKDQKLMRDFSQLNRITSELQKLAMSLRMVPIKQTFQKMIRLVRDLAKKSDKAVELHMSGEDTEIDRNMVDAIYDPLVHMIRNGVDHGIEVPSERRRKGKLDTGTIWLRAYQKGGNIVIEIEDDGNGLSREKILNKAREKGLVKSGENLSTYETDNLIFQAGFSTADKITDVSGRGVGMDVVKRAIEQLRGKVEINSRPGQGSTFTIKLPLTLAIIDGIVVKVGPERYIIPTTAIKETIRPREGEYSTVHGKGEMIKVRGNLIPLVRLYRMFNVPSEHTNPCEALVVVVENEGRQKCLLVDDLLGKQEAVIKSLGEHMKNVKGLAGGTILGDGKVGLILDINGLFSVAEEQTVIGL